MTLTIEDGSGLSTADTYNEVADVQAYLDEHDATAATAWTGAALSDAEIACRVAARYMDAVYGPRLQGEIRIVDQALEWPRIGVRRDRFCLSSSEVPQKWRDAHALLSSKALSAELLPDIAAPVGAIRRVKKKVGPLETETEYFGASQVKRYSEIDAMVADFLESGGIVAERA